MFANLSICTARYRRWFGQEYNQEVYSIDTLPIGTLPNVWVTRLTLWGSHKKFLSRLKSLLISSGVSRIYILTAFRISVDGATSAGDYSSRTATLRVSSGCEDISSGDETTHKPSKS